MCNGPSSGIPVPLCMYNKDDLLQKGFQATSWRICKEKDLHPTRLSPKPWSKGS